MSEREVVVSLELIDRYRFNVSFEKSGAELLMDEPEPLGDGAGPNASAVLSAAIGNCLSASLLFCLRKARIDPSGVKTTVRTQIDRNESGRLRVVASRVEIELETGEEPERLSRCLALFEDFCLVTQAVRDGIEVDVTVISAKGEELHRSTDSVPE
jgi:uncharacterized OsmC-like protein